MKKPFTAKTRKIIFRSSVALLIIWAVALPFIMQKKSNETLEDISTSVPNTNQTLPESNKAQPNQPVAMPASGLQTVSNGTFKGLNGRSASGNVTLIKADNKYFIRLEDNFSVSSGPDLFVTVGNDERVSEQISELKGNSGGQNYELPASFDPSKYNQVIIHCRAFAYSFGVATLSPAN